LILGVGPAPQVTFQKALIICVDGIYVDGYTSTRYSFFARHLPPILLQGLRLGEGSSSQVSVMLSRGAVEQLNCHLILFAKDVF